jgi:Ca2+-transporting ATPase
MHPLRVAGASSAWSHSGSSVPPARAFAMAAVEATPRAARALLDGTAWHTLPGIEATRRLRVNRLAGLSAAEAETRLAELGPNRIAAEAAEPRWAAFWRAYGDAWQLVLLAAAIAALALGELATGLVLVALTAVNAALGLRREGLPGTPVEALRRMLPETARARRGGGPVEIPAERLVLGDIVDVRTGDVVPADGRILDSTTLEVDEAALTGAGAPARKGVDVIDDPGAPLGDRTDMLYATARVVRGSARYVVTATGMATEVGRIAQVLGAPEPSDTRPTGLPAALTRRMLALAGAALAVCVVVGVARGETLEALLALTVAFAVAAVPSGLPAAVSAVLARGAALLGRAGALVRRPRAAELLGVASALDVQQAGTLTSGEPTAVELALPGRRWSVSGHGFGTAGRVTHPAGQGEPSLEPLLLPLVLASDATVTDGVLAGDPVEGALVVLAEKAGIDVPVTRELHPRVAALPFDAAYRCMATFHRLTDEAGRDVVRCFVRGAPDQLLGRAAAVLGTDLLAVALDEDLRGRYAAENARLAGLGLRVVATGRRDVRAAGFDPAADLLPLVDGLTLLALVGILDPPRPDAAAAIARARDAGVRVRIVTADHALTARGTARRLGADGIEVMAEATPTQRQQRVEALRHAGQVVVATGAGVGDAPALRAADVGVATGADAGVAAEVAAVTVTDGGLPAIVRAVEWGRAVHDGVVACVRFQVGVVAGLLLTFLGAGVLDVAGGLAFLPLQTLYLTFTALLLQSVALGAPGPPVAAGAPRAAGAPLVSRRDAGWIAAVGAIQAAVALGVLAMAERAHDIATARTMGLVTFSLSVVLLSYGAHRARRRELGGALAGHGFAVAGALSFAAIVGGAQTGVMQRMIGTVALDFRQWLLCVGAACTIAAAAELGLIRRRTRGASPGPASPTRPGAPGSRDPACAGT